MRWFAVLTLAMALGGDTVLRRRGVSNRRRSRRRQARGAAKAEKNLREAFDAADVGRQASLA